MLACAQATLVLHTPADYMEGTGGMPHATPAVASLPLLTHHACRRYAGRKVMLGVDRLDMIKGIPQV